MTTDNTINTPNNTSNNTPSNTLNHPVANLEPKEVWSYFYQLTQIPRPSHHEEAIQQFMLDFGKSLGLDTLKDEVGNIIIKKPATQGMEHCKPVILQSHLDMVAQANKDSQHDFATDPLQVYIDEVTSDTPANINANEMGQWVKAHGTTLGADNGMGVAAIMAVLASDDIAHPDIEALFTSTEETGMVGAFGLQPNMLGGEILLNLDSEELGELYIGCAGGVDVTAKMTIRRQPIPDGMAIHHIKLTGLRGGHSGLNIIDQRANANKLLVRWLLDLDDVLGDQWRLIRLDGGNLRNAIPREADAIIAFDPVHLDDIKRHLTDHLLTLASEYQGIENVKNKMSMTIEPVQHGNTQQDKQPTDAIVPDDAQKVLNVIHACPNGVYRMSVSMNDLVETSVNMGIVSTDEHQITISQLIRSSLDSSKQDLSRQLQSLYTLAGASVELSGNYLGWSPNMNSDILKVMQHTGKELFGQSPALKGIHAGLECGILARHYPHWDMISFGPTITGAHSPDERVKVDTVAVFFDWLKMTLAHIPKR